MPMAAASTCCASPCPSWLARFAPWLLALAGGALLPLALAPFGLWLLAPVSAALLFLAVSHGAAARTCIAFYLYNLAMLALGVSWIYVSIERFGGASPWLAGALVALFVLAYALIALPQAWLYAWLRRRDASDALLFTALWVLQEAFRGWFLTGFPWLFAGYALLLTPFDGLAPVAGVLGLSALAALAGALGVVAVRAASWRLGLALAGALLAALACKGLDFTHPVGTRSVSLVQGNIDQRSKWLPGSRAPILARYQSLSESEYGRDILLWPEMAITLPRTAARDYLAAVDSRAKAAGTSVFLGLPDTGPAGGLRNALLGLGEGQGSYHKRRLVPFGEYVPLEAWLRGLIAFFDLPMSRTQPGPARQAPLMAGDLRLSASICYEVVYPELVRASAPAPDLLVTVSNDTWFGDSIGPHQHLQMAQMRALENGRALLRATNNGVTAIIDHRGRTIAQAPQFQQAALRGQVELRAGLTPFQRFGSWPLLALCALLLLALAGRAAFR